jgi:starvation-inducible outer membrane lipoprotein
MKALIAIAAAALLLSGCARDPVETSRTDNPQINVEKLFEHDGCSVYRFMDGGNFVYYTNCQGSTQTSRGKYGDVNVTTTRTGQ